MNLFGGALRVACCAFGILVPPLIAAETNGFAVKFTAADGKATDFMVLPNLWLFVQRGQPPTPFVPGGKFTAEFNGFINADLRGTYFFEAEQLAGTIKLDINGSTVLNVSGAGGRSGVSKAVQLNKGPNAVKATFASGEGDAFVRIGWTEKGTNVNPIPNSAITPARTPELQNAERNYAGRELFMEHRCARCHATSREGTVPELAMEAPTFEGIGQRRNIEWLARWVRDPNALRTQASMPRLLHGASATNDARAIAAYLGSLKTKPPAIGTPGLAAHAENAKALVEIDKRSGAGAKATLSEAGEPADTGGERKPLFERLHCVGCHVAPDSTEADPARIGLNHVAEKFSEGAVIDFLKAPERHYTWIRMPNFKLADSEAKELASFLLKNATKAESSPPPADKESIERGRTLVETLGCLNCHALGTATSSLVAPPLARVRPEPKGCLAEKHTADSKAPDFGFDTAQRAALIAFLKTDRSSLSRHAPMEFAERQMRVLRCNGCHGQIDLAPPLEILGGKLKPEWAAAFIGGTPFKVRADVHPKGAEWVQARMPAFPTRAQLLAEGMAAQQGYPPKTPDEGPIDEAAAKIGHKMIGKDNGLSCISCHAVNDMPALEVFDSEGINLGLSAARLLKPYFFRWMRNPLAIDPQTKMPAFFGEDGKSALTDYYDGDGEQQVNALYQYIRMGERMPKPSTGAE